MIRDPMKDSTRLPPGNGRSATRIYRWEGLGFNVAASILVVLVPALFA